MCLTRLICDNLEDLAMFLNFHDLTACLMSTNTYTRNILVYSKKVIKRKIRIQQCIIHTCIYHYEKKSELYGVQYKKFILKNIDDYTSNTFEEIFTILDDYLSYMIKPAQKRICSLQNFQKNLMPKKQLCKF